MIEAVIFVALLPNLLLKVQPLAFPDVTCAIFILHVSFLRTLIWLQGEGSNTELVKGTSSGSLPTTVARSPDLTGNEKSIVYNPRNMKYYFIRDSVLKEFDPKTRAVKTLTEDPVYAIRVAPKGKLLYATDSKVVLYDPTTMRTKTVMRVTEPVDSLELTFETKGTKPTDKTTDTDSEADKEDDGAEETSPVYVYYTAGDQVVKVNQNDPTDKEIIEVAGASNYVVDPKNKVLFYVMFGQNIIREQPIGGDKTFIVRGAGKISSLKLDQEDRVLYFTDSLNGEIKSYDLDTKRETLIYAGLSNPEKINIDPSTG